jgi:hypothetical protein
LADLRARRRWGLVVHRHETIARADDCGGYLRGPSPFRRAPRCDGTVVSWGYTNLASTLVPPGLSNVTAISAGGFHTLALRREAVPVAVGGSSFRRNQCANRSNQYRGTSRPVISIMFALRSDGRRLGLGLTECQLASRTSVILCAVGAGFELSLALVRPRTQLFPLPRMWSAALEQGTLRFEFRRLRGRRYFVEENSGYRKRLVD